MSPPIGNACVRNVITVTTDSTVAEAASLMRKHHIGAVVIVDAGEGAAKPVAAGLAPQTLKVAEIVQRPITTVTEDASCAEVVRLMSVNGVRRLPVVDAKGALVGIVALDDLLLHLVTPLVAVADLAARERRFETSTRA
jgi:CBS domain-containing protein